MPNPEFFVFEENKKKHKILWQQLLYNGFIRKNSDNYKHNFLIEFLLSKNFKENQEYSKKEFWFFFSKLTKLNNLQKTSERAIVAKLENQKRIFSIGPNKVFFDLNEFENEKKIFSKQMFEIINKYFQDNEICFINIKRFIKKMPLTKNIYIYNENHLIEILKKYSPDFVKTFNSIRQPLFFKRKLNFKKTNYENNSIKLFSLQLKKF